MNLPAHRALIVEDDDKIVDVIQDHLDSLGHSYDRAATQAEARKLLVENKYCYVLLDLEIPVKRKHIADMSHGINLLEEIARKPESCKTQIIIMTSHGTDEPYLALDMVAKGAVTFLGKPFAVRGRHTPCATVKEVLNVACKHAPAGCPLLGGEPLSEAEEAPADPKALTPFAGGTLVFHERYVEFMGESVVTARAKESWRAIQLLAGKKADGEYVAYSGEGLLEALGLEQEKGQPDAAGYIKYLRDRFEQILRKQGFSSDRQDVIESGGRGYRLNPWIEVEDLDA